MAMTDRQKMIIHLLQKNEHTSEKIAEHLQVSTRTVMRDIAELNYSLQKMAIGTIEADAKGYHLRIDNDDKFYHYVGLKRNLPFNFLLELASAPEVSLVDFQEKFYLSKMATTKILAQLKRQYSPYIDIVSKPSKGYQLVADYSTRLFLVANIFLVDQGLLFEQFSLQPIQYQQIVTLLQNAGLSTQITSLSEPQFLALVFAAIKVYPGGTPALNNTLSHVDIEPHQSGMLADDITAIQTFLRLFYQQLNTITKGKIDPLRLQALVAHLLNVRAQRQALTIDNITVAISQASLVYHMNFKATSSLIIKIFNHLERCIVFPHLLDELDEIDELIHINPMVYNVSNYFLTTLNKIQGFTILDHAYVFLYFLSNYSGHSAKHDIHLISSRWSVASINKQLIEDKIPSANIRCYVDEQNLSTIPKHHYIIWNNDENIPSSLVPNLTVKGIFDQPTLTLLKSHLEEVTIKTGITQRFRQAQIITIELANPHKTTWLEVIEQCCQILLEQQWIVTQEARQLILRETQGHALIINGIAIPHASSVYIEQFALFYFQLSHPLTVEGNIVNQLLFVLVNPARKENSNIFSYLYKVLNQYHPEDLKKIQSLQQLQSLLLADNIDEN